MRLETQAEPAWDCANGVGALGSGFSPSPEDSKMGLFLGGKEGEGALETQGLDAHKESFPECLILPRLPKNPLTSAAGGGAEHPADSTGRAVHCDF